MATAVATKPTGVTEDDEEWLYGGLGIFILTHFTKIECFFPNLQSCKSKALFLIEILL